MDDFNEKFADSYRICWIDEESEVHYIYLNDHYSLEEVLYLLMSKVNESEVVAYVNYEPYSQKIITSIAQIAWVTKELLVQQDFSKVSFIERDIN